MAMASGTDGAYSRTSGLYSLQTYGEAIQRQGDSELAAEIFALVERMRRRHQQPVEERCGPS